MDIKELYSLFKKNELITTDSRNCPPRSIFIALKGETFDGNRFATQALAQGCSLAVVDDEKVYEQYRNSGGDTAKMMLVTDSLQTYKDLAREHRRRFSIPILGITGTNGKTTTKELVHAVLSKKFNVMATQGNFNNDVGVPKTLFRLTAEHEIAVVEMGASHPGDIKTLAETAEPTCGLITNVGKAHLQGFGSFEGVVSTKGELYDYLATRNHGLIFLNASNEHLAAIRPAGVSAVTYSSQAVPTRVRVEGEIVACDPFLRLRWRDNESQSPQWYEVSTHLIGSYNIDNVLAAVAVGLHFGVEPEQIVEAIEGYVPSNNRSQLTTTAHNHLVVDAYNANPTSMAAALTNFKMMQVPAKMAILGEMRELGASSEAEHRHLVEQLDGCGFDEVWLVGAEFAPINCNYRKFADVEQVKQALTQHPVEGRYILIKGSNGTRLFQLPELL